MQKNPFRRRLRTCVLSVLVLFSILCGSAGLSTGSSLPVRELLTSSTTKATEQTTKQSTTSSTTKKKTTTSSTTKESTTKAKDKKKSEKKKTEKVIYLTFDDGPGPYTDKLLGILEKNNVHATFFVTAQYPRYEYLIGKAYAQGNAIGVHTYSHNYSKIYKSRKAYWKDYAKMNHIVFMWTGHKTTLFRFPGGSSNTVSRKYKSGIMTTLTKASNKKDFTYVDWNVDSFDASTSKTAKQVYKSLVKGVKAQGDTPSVILCHDVKSYTVNAMNKFIKWALDNGYTFKVLSEGGYTVHHTVNN